jgi:hypothetical protein
VAWEHDTAVRWRPDASRESPVVIDPDVRLGAPSVGGISTNLVGAVRRRRRRPGSRQHLRTDPGTGALGTGVRGDSSSVSWAQAGGGPLLLRRRHVRSREPLVSGTSRLHLSWRPRWADQEAGAPPCAIKTPAGPDSEWSPTVANSAGSLSLETGTSKTELRIWSAVLMPSMRLCPGVQNSGASPSVLPLEVDPTLNRLTFYLVMATLVLAVETLLLAFFQGLSRLESGSLPGAPLATHPRIGNRPGSTLTRRRGPWC